ncbi:hypothetical protein [Thalassobacillus pellis]|uniref:hypothetical protein n=1 Tax=Thalassobacillus pellis TaxID=748008 RepID=UPI001960653E|nr:hypothetical protein [Thalassobacillus pellis]MBM7554880.1 spore coat protein YutH [Thalassobacillus pellis]
MDQILSNYIDIRAASAVNIDDNHGYEYQGDYYFILPAFGGEGTYHELSDACSFLMNAGVHNIVYPVLGKENRYCTSFDQQTFVVCRASYNPQRTPPLTATQLASFHQIGSTYPYQLTNLSSYGQWKQLWAQRIDQFEAKIGQLHQERPVGKLHRLWLDSAPYVVGMGENAIQYLQESEQEKRHQEGDQATFTFDRYPTEPQRYIWCDQLRSDHPSRDLAESLRRKLLADENPAGAAAFLSEYQSAAPLSVFGLRLLYARLLFPVHLLDQFDYTASRIFEEGLLVETKEMFDNQKYYEKHLHNFFHMIKMSPEQLDIPTLDW